MKYTIKITTDQWSEIVNALGNNMEDYFEMPGSDSQVEHNKQVKKRNAFLQRLIDNLTKQIREQV